MPATVARGLQSGIRRAALQSPLPVRDLNDEAPDRGSGPPNRSIMNKGFLKAGHLPTLSMAFLYFDLSFMAWVVLGPLGMQIGKTLDLDAGQKGLMVAVPVLAG